MESTDSNTSEDLYGIYFTDPKKGRAVGVNGTILHTEDGGYGLIFKYSV